MELDLKSIRKTTHNKFAGAVRMILGGMFLMTGLVKLTVPSLRAAFEFQLQSANIPLTELNMLVVPIIEIIIGIILFIGVMSRVGAFVVIGLMTVATYVHLVAEDPTLFPLQPQLPIIPVVVIALSIYLMIVGGGAWSRDLKSS